MDMQQVVAARRSVHPDGVIEVARGFTVDRHHVHAAEIRAARGLVPANGGRERLRLLQHLRRKSVRQMVLADDNLDVHAEIVGIAEDLDHAPYRILPAPPGTRAPRH